MGLNKTVNFSTAKLLKEKGYNKSHKKIYNTIGQLWDAHHTTMNNDNPDSGACCVAPTIADVVMWLWEKHDIWIRVDRVVIGSDEWEYGYVISYLPKEFENAKRRSIHLKTKESFREGIGSYDGAWSKPTEAYEAAIEYCLTNLFQPQ